MPCVGGPGLSEADLAIDEPMFRYFPYSAGVKNVLDFVGQLRYLPAYVASRDGGNGFEEIAETILS